jgi:hypothetical protein
VEGPRQAVVNPKVRHSAVGVRFIHARDSQRDDSAQPRRSIVLPATLNLIEKKGAYLFQTVVWSGKPFALISFRIHDVTAGCNIWIAGESKSQRKGT